MTDKQIIQQALEQNLIEPHNADIWLEVCEILDNNLLDYGWPSK